MNCAARGIPIRSDREPPTARPAKTRASGGGVAELDAGRVSGPWKRPSDTSRTPPRSLTNSPTTSRPAGRDP